MERRTEQEQIDKLDLLLMMDFEQGEWAMTQATGWIVPVWTERMGGGQPMLVAYGTIADTAGEAQEAVKAGIEALPGDEIREPASISRESAEALGLRAGKVRMI